MLVGTIQTLLEEFVGKDPVVLGEETGGQRAAQLLSTRLWAAHRDARLLQFIAGAMILVLFLATIVGLSVSEIGTVTLGAVAAASGATLSGLIILMLRCARQMHESTLLAAMVERLPEEDVRDVMLALLRAKGSASSKVQ